MAAPDLSFPAPPPPDITQSPTEILGRFPQQAVPQAGPAPGSVDAMESGASQARRQFGQFQQQQQQQQQPGAQPGQQSWSEGNPYAQQALDLQQKYQQSAQPPPSGGMVKRFLSNWMSTMSDASSRNLGLPTAAMQRQQLFDRAAQAAQLADQFENIRSEVQLRQQQIANSQQEQSQRAQLFPGQLQEQGIRTQAEQFGLDQARQNAPTAISRMPLDATTAQLAGIPQKFVDQPLSEGDWKMVDARIQARGFQRFDTGQDGTGPGKGIWILDRGGNPYKQIGTVSESARSTAIAKMQLKMQQDAANPKVGNMLVGTNPEGSQVAGTEQELRAAGVSNITKLGAGEAEKVNVARQLTSPTGLFSNIDSDLAAFRPEELTTIGAHWNEFVTGKIGTGDPRYAALRTHVDLLSTALMQAHVGSRGSVQMMEHFRNLANAGRMNGEVLKSALSAEKTYVNEKAMRPKGGFGAGGGDFFSQFGGKPR